MKISYLELEIIHVDPAKHNGVLTPIESTNDFGGLNHSLFRRGCTDCTRYSRDASTSLIQACLYQTDQGLVICVNDNIDLQVSIVYNLIECNLT